MESASKARLCENVFCPGEIGGGEKKKIALFGAETLKSALSSHRQKSRPEFEIEVKTGEKIFSSATFGKSALLWLLRIYKKVLKYTFIFYHLKR